MSIVESTTFIHRNSPRPPLNPKRGSLAVSTFLLLLVWALPSFAIEADLGTKVQQESGKKLYNKLCAQCHGESGDGKGPAYSFLKPWPRNFTKGIFKFKSTPDDRLPTTKDILRVIRNGNPYTGMPAWPQLTDDDVRNLAYYIKTFSSDFSDPNSLADESIAPIPLKIPSKAPKWNKKSALLQGKQLFSEHKCKDCHGLSGFGSGSSALTTEDMDQNQIYPRDLSKRWTFRNGSSRLDIFRTISMGMAPMPSFHDLSEEERWRLVDYVYSLGTSDNPNYGTVVLSKGVEGMLDLAKGVELFKEASPVYFPVMGQITQPGRAFYASAEGVEVVSVYNKDEIAFLVTWHDMSAEINQEVITSDKEKEGDNWEEDSWGDENLDDQKVPEEETQKIEQQNAPNMEVLEIPPENQTKEKPAQYSDAVAIQIPSNEVKDIIKPYFIFGDKDRAIDLWFADLANVTDKASVYVAKGAKNMKMTDEKIDFSGSYNDGQWITIFKRKLIKENGISFKEGQFTPMAFSIWDGFNNERGNKRGLTSWMHVYLKPMKEKSIVGKLFIALLITIVLELAFVYMVRRKIRRKHV